MPRILPSLPGPLETSGCSARFSAPPRAQNICYWFMVCLSKQEDAKQTNNKLQHNSSEKLFKVVTLKYLPLGQLSTLLCTFQVTLNDHQLTGHLKSHHTKLKFTTLVRYIKSDRMNESLKVTNVILIIYLWLVGNNKHLTESGHWGQLLR